MPAGSLAGGGARRRTLVEVCQDYGGVFTGERLQPAPPHSTLVSQRTHVPRAVLLSPLSTHDH